MIPKIIHYIWLGGNEYPDVVTNCINSWKKYAPDFQLKLWNEETFDISTAPKFVKDAYSHKMWAFASDYIRLWALYNYGGIYLDTDTEIRRPIDKFLSDRLFISTQQFNVEKKKNIIVPVTNLSMGVIGSEEGHQYLKDCMDAISKSQLINPDGSLNTKVTNYTMSDVLQQKYGFVVEDTEQHLEDGIVVYPSSYFSDRLSPNEAPDCYTFHWGQMSWFHPKKRGLFYKLCWNLNLMSLYSTIENLRK